MAIGSATIHSINGTDFSTLNESFHHTKLSTNTTTLFISYCITINSNSTVSNYYAQLTAIPHSF